jgi:carboxyl-terminal processing protease
MDIQPLWQRRRHFYTAMAFVAIFTAGFVMGNMQFLSRAQYLNGDVLPPADAEQTFAPFWEAYNLIQKDYVDKPDAEKLVDGAIKGMVEALDDQYSGYVDPELFPFVNDSLSGAVEGIGAVVSEIEETGEVEIANVMEGTPAERAGIREGDVFVSVDGEDVTGMTYLEIVSRVRGAAGSTVNLMMRRGEEMLEFAIERARIEIPNIETEIYEGEIGYLKLNQFTGEARTQMDEALTEMDVYNLNGLIIDLRGNPGGYLDSAIEVTSLLVEDGPVVYEQFNDGTEHTFNAEGTSFDLDIPVVLLIDERSASASEIVAGAWQDTGVATIMGTTSFGKGTVQKQVQLTNGGGVRLTIARWLRPNREWIHDIGVTPDVVVEWTVEDREANPDDDPQLEAALEFFAQPEREAVQ